VTVTHSNWLDQCTYRCTYGRRLTYRSPSEPIEIFERPRTWRHMQSTMCAEVHRQSLTFGYHEFTPWRESNYFGICRKGAFSRVSEEFEAKGLSKLLYSVVEAATLLSCSRGTIYSLIRSGEIFAVYPNSNARITATSLVRFVERMETESRSERQAQRSLTR